MNDWLAMLWGSGTAANGHLKILEAFFALLFAQILSISLFLLVAHFPSWRSNKVYPLNGIWTKSCVTKKKKKSRANALKCKVRSTLILELLDSCRFQRANCQVFWTIDFTIFTYKILSFDFYSQHISLCMSRTCQTYIVALLWNRVGVAPTESSFTFSV